VKVSPIGNLKKAKKKNDLSKAKQTDKPLKKNDKRNSRPKKFICLHSLFDRKTIENYL